MSNPTLHAKIAQLAEILQYVHDHTGKFHPPSMLHVNNMIDRLQGGHPTASVAQAEIERLIANWALAPMPKPP